MLYLHFEGLSRFLSVSVAKGNNLCSHQSQEEVHEAAEVTLDLVFCSSMNPC